MSIPDLTHFDWQFYCQHHHDLRKAGIDNQKKAIDHYLKFGHTEQRLINPKQIPINHMETANATTTMGGGGYSDNCSFFDSSDSFYQDFLKHTEIKSGQVILEIGCDQGQLRQILSDHHKITYYGLDLDKNKINQCKTNLKYPLTTFQTFRPQTHRSHGLNHTKLTLPIKDHSCDWIWMPTLAYQTSPAQLQDYLHEISRALKPKGKCLVSTYLWTPNIQKYHITNHEDYWQIQNQQKETITSVSESQLIKWLDKVKLSINKVSYGNWSGYPTENLHRDLILIEKHK